MERSTPFSFEKVVILIGTRICKSAVLGLGHATRDIPIIRELMDNGHEVTIATSRGAFQLLKKECPDCEFIYFEDYPAPYSSTRYFLPKFIANIPLLVKALADEKKRTERLLSETTMML